MTITIYIQFESWDGFEADITANTDLEEMEADSPILEYKYNPITHEMKFIRIID